MANAILNIKENKNGSGGTVTFAATNDVFDVVLDMFRDFFELEMLTANTRRFKYKSVCTIKTTSAEKIKHLSSGIVRAYVQSMSVEKPSNN